MLLLIQNLICQPVYLLFEFIYQRVYKHTHGYFRAILALSLICGILIYLLYRKVPFIRLIRKDQEGHKKVDRSEFLKGIALLILQAVLFIVPYQFFTGMEQLQGVSNLFLKDLGKCDGLLSISGSTINILPILAAMISFASALILMKGKGGIKAGIAILIIDLGFTIFLYNAPSALNVFRTGFHFCLLMMTAGEWVIRKRIVTAEQQERKTTIPQKEKRTGLLFILGGVYLTLLVGGLIPSSIIASSPGEFIDEVSWQSPVIDAFLTMSIAAGAFIMWPALYYSLACSRGKRLISTAMWIIAGACTINYLFFGQGLGNLSPKLVYDIQPVFSKGEWFINLGILLAVGAVFWLIYRKSKTIVLLLYAVMTLMMAVVTGINLIQTQQKIDTLEGIIQGNKTEPASIPLSTKGKNVIVLMMDRSMNMFFPYAIQEDPELKRQFDGFTYYPNTVSMGTSTNAGAPALFGGYEYSPYEINKRKTETLEQKHNEALKVLPTLFEKNGYTVTVCDPPYAGYEWIPDLSIYNDNPGIKAFITKGKYESKNEERDRNKNPRLFFSYSLMKAAPLFLQGNLYDKGSYNDTKIYKEPDYDENFIKDYAVLENLPRITKIQRNETDTFLMMDNETTHWATMLQLPDYAPAVKIDMKENEAYEAAHQDRFEYDGQTLKIDSEWKLKHYYSFMAAYKQLGNWMDWLRNQGVFDNTRIIIASDHGYKMAVYDNMFLENGFDLEWFMPLLLVKDFNATGITVSDQFMSNADVPTLSTKGLIEPAINPFTGKEINGEKEKQEKLTVYHTGVYSIDENNGNTFIDDPDDEWLKVHDNIYDLNNWEKIDRPKD